MSEGPDAGTFLVGMFLIVAGACIALAGGGCTLFLVVNIGDLFRGDGGLGLLLLGASLVTLLAGVLAIWGGLKLVRGR